MKLTPQQQVACTYIKTFSYYNPHVPINWKVEPVEYANYLRTILINMHAVNGTSYKDPARLPPVNFNQEPIPSIPTPAPSNPPPIRDMEKLADIAEDLEKLASMMQTMSTDLVQAATIIRKLR